MASIVSKFCFTKDGKKFNIRNLQIEDAQNFIQHALLMFNTSDQVLSYPEEFKMTLEEERNWIKKNLDHPASLLLIAEHEGKIIGDITLQGGSRKKISHTGEIGMGIAPEWRGLGIGTALMETLIDFARNNPYVEKINLSVFNTNKAGISLYQKIGFLEVGRRINQFKQKDGSYADEIMMTFFCKT